MGVTPAGRGEQPDQARISQYIDHLRALYGAKRTEAYRELLIPEEKPCAFSLTRLERLPFRQEGSGAEQPCWQLISHTGIRLHPDLKKEYSVTDGGRLRFSGEMLEPVPPSCWTTGTVRPETSTRGRVT